jgi:hypothetical protein
MSGSDLLRSVSPAALDRCGVVTLRSAPHTTEEEESVMLGNIITAVKNTIVGWARTATNALKGLARPARAVVAATAGIARDATRSRRELLAENAFLRQQLIVLRRSVKRPALGRAQRHFNASRPHQGIAQRIPGEGHCDRPVNSEARVAAMPILGGLHHDYRWAAYPSDDALAALDGKGSQHG